MLRFGRLFHGIHNPLSQSNSQPACQPDAHPLHHSHYPSGDRINPNNAERTGERVGRRRAGVLVLVGQQKHNKSSVNCEYFNGFGTSRTTTMMMMLLVHRVSDARVCAPVRNLRGNALGGVLKLGAWRMI